jgi:integrase
VYQRKDGRWVGELDLGASGGQRRRKTFYGRTQGEVIAKVRTAQSTVAKGLPLPAERQTIEGYLAWYTETVLPTPRMKESTAVQYRQIIDAYINPHIGKVRLARLAPSHVHELQTALAKQGLGPSTIRYARAVLSGALRHAERHDLVGRNVVRLVDAPPKTAPLTDDTLTQAEAVKLLKGIEGHRLEALVTVALSIGLRRGEALALRWSDVDVQRKVLTVPGTLKRRPGGGLYVDRPKTAASAATVPLPDRCLKALARHRKVQAEERLAAGPLWHDEGFIFTTPIGTPIDGSNALKIFYGMCDLAGVPRRRFHALRHSAATLMWEQGVPLDVISATLRHSGLSITKDTYIAFRPEVMRTGADAMDRALG